MTIPAYLSTNAPAGSSGELSANLWKEQLPAAPQRPWPMTALGDRRGDTHSLPWCQFAAYADQRVEGPKTVSGGLHNGCLWASADPLAPCRSQFLYGIKRASWAEPAATERRSSWGHTWTRPLAGFVSPRDRFHSDLLAVTHNILDTMTYSSYLQAEDFVKLLERGILAQAYESWHRSSIDCLPGASSAGHSKLFSTCYWVSAAAHASHFLTSDNLINCLLRARSQCLLAGLASGPPTTRAAAVRMSKDECPNCYRRLALAITIPEAMRQLLLRIVRPGKLQDGTDDIVTAKEALDVMNGVLEV